MKYQKRFPRCGNISLNIQTLPLVTICRHTLYARIIPHVRTRGWHYKTLSPDFTRNIPVDSSIQYAFVLTGTRSAHKSLHNLPTLSFALISSKFANKSLHRERSLSLSLFLSGKHRKIGIQYSREGPLLSRQKRKEGDLRGWGRIDVSSSSFFMGHSVLEKPVDGLFLIISFRQGNRHFVVNLLSGIF